MRHEEDPGTQVEDGDLMMRGVNKKASNATNGIGVKEIGGPLLVRYPVTTKYPSCINSKINTTIAYPSLVRSSLVIEK
jgi:hypothetical protein